MTNNIERVTLTPENKTIYTGYMIGGQTWISRAWNNGTLTKADIEDSLDGYRDELRSWEESDVRQEIAESEAECAQELFEDQEYKPLTIIGRNVGQLVHSIYHAVRKREWVRPNFDRVLRYSYRHFLEQCVDRELELRQSEMDSVEGVIEAFEDLVDNWSNDEHDLYDFVYVAHSTLDDYCRAMKCG